MSNDTSPFITSSYELPASSEPVSAPPTDKVTLYVCRLQPLEVLFNTRTIVAMLGYDAESFPHMTLETVHELLHPDDLARLTAHVQRLHTLADGEVAEFRHRMRAPSGHWAWIEVRDSVLKRNAAGQPTEIIGTAREITDQMRTAEALVASEARHRLLAETMLQGVVHHAADGRIIALNPAAERILGRPREQFVGSDPMREEKNTISADGSLFPGSEHPASVAIRTGEPCRDVVMGVYNWELREYRWLRVDAVPLLRRGETTPYEVYTVFEDITERLRSEQALRDAHTRKDHFIATLAHELRNPLAPIRHAVAMQQLRASDDAELAWSHAVIARQVGHMARLLDDLLDASRIASGKLELRREPVSLASVITQAIETARPLLDAAQHVFTVTLPDTEVMLDGDAVRLAQVFSNLLTNAAKYTEPGGRITMTSEVDDGTVVVRVRDSGIGIDSSNLSRVFEMFGQVEAAVDRSQGGLGIGLSLAQSLVDMHGGRISVHSEGKGHGTEFTVHLPVTGPADVAQRRTPHLATPVVGAARRRILVVDDNVDGCDTLGALLGLLGFEVEMAYDGPAAIVSEATFLPHVVLLDVGLPGMNGYEVCSTLRSHLRGDDLVIIAVTGWGAEADLQRAMDAGFDAHMVKPVDMSQLAQLLHLPREIVQERRAPQRQRAARPSSMHAAPPDR
ncbi:MAG TPA: ATP-binding protein [Gemmatimonadaceae bacterium]|nr:ATP-binding protein [Gemmatimonadaceae bacterium]